MRRFALIGSLLILGGLFFFIGFKAGGHFPAPALNRFFKSESAAEEEQELLLDEIEEEEIYEPDLRTINLIALGNIFPHEPNIKQAHMGDGVYDFTPTFTAISPLIQAADLAVADLETSQAGPDVLFWGYKGYTGYPLFNSPQALSEALYEAGVGILTLGNNHALDRGYEGLMVSLDFLRSLGIKTFGAYKSPEERDTPLIIEEDGIKIAFIGYTFSTNGIPVPDGHEYCLNYAPGFDNYQPVIDDMDKAKEMGADLIAVFPHWGDSEYASEPSPQYYRQVAEALAAAGADLIIGGHPKFVQPIEWFFNEDEEGGERATFAIYAQGTFLSNQHYPANVSPFVEYHLLLDLELSKDMETGKAWLSDVDYEITWIQREHRHRILPLSEVFASSPERFNLSASKVEELKSWHQRNVDAAEAYNYQEGKAKALEISRHRFKEAETK